MSEEIPLKDGIEPCPTCGASLRYRWAKSPFHQQAIKSLDRCERCQESLEQSKLQRRLELEGPEKIRASGIPKERQHESLDPGRWPELQVDSGNQAAIAALGDWIQNGTGLYLWGQTGTGKSTLARAAILDCCRLAQDCQWLSEKQLVQDMKTFQRSLFERAWTVPVLCIDDIASREVDRTLLTAYRDIFDGREECGGKTLITGQLPPKDLLNHWRVDNQLRQDISYRLRSALGGSQSSDGNAAEVTGQNRRRRG